VEGLPPVLRSNSAAEVAERLFAQRRGAPFLIYRDGERRQRIVELAQEIPAVHVGRAPACEIALPWDGEVSRVHARLELAGDEWTLVDDGLSRNGSYVNGRRVRGRRRLADGDEIGIGRTLLVFASGPEPPLKATETAGDHAPPPLSDAQRRVLVALCRPLVADPFAGPPSNREIAEALFVSVETVKSHLRVLFERFEVQGIPQNRKRAELARRALERGVVTR
jgi:FHA domain/Bacterial regulatory proteins, luxR family